MAWLVAELSYTEITMGDGRGSRRHQLNLVSRAKAAGDSVRVLVLNLSETGMMIQTTAHLEVDDAIQIELPEVGQVEAHVVWKKDGRYGCEFLTPVEKNVVSAAMLKSSNEAVAMPAGGLHAVHSLKSVQNLRTGYVSPKLEAAIVIGVALVTITALLLKSV